MWAKIVTGYNQYHRLAKIIAITEITVSNEVKASKLICQSNDNKIAAEIKAIVRESALAPRAIGQKTLTRCFGPRNRGTLDDTSSITVAPDVKK